MATVFEKGFAELDGSTLAGALSFNGTDSLAPASVWSKACATLKGELGEDTFGSWIAQANLRQGRGGRLLSAAISEATMRGAAAMFLEVSERNNAAKQLYRNHGFVTVGFRRHYYPDGSNADVMRRPLTYGAAAGA